MKLHYPTFLTGLAVAALALLSSCGGSDYGGGGMTNYTPPPTTPMTEMYSATLNGSSEVPPNPSMATGSATLSVDTTTLAMTVSITTSGIAGTAAHVHQGAVGVSGPIIFPLTESYAGSGIWMTSVTLSATQLATLRAGNYYVNVHSVAYPAGEIRGQLKRP